MSVKPDGSPCRREQPDCKPRQGRLAASRFADQSQRGAARNVQRHVIYCEQMTGGVAAEPLHPASGAGEPMRHVFQLEQRNVTRRPDHRGPGLRRRDPTRRRCRCVSQHKVQRRRNPRSCRHLRTGSYSSRHLRFPTCAGPIDWRAHPGAGPIHAGARYANPRPGLGPHQDARFRFRPRRGRGLHTGAVSSADPPARRLGPAACEQRRMLRPASFDGVPTPGVKGASRRHHSRTRHRAINLRQPRDALMDRRDAAHQAYRVGGAQDCRSPLQPDRSR